MHNITFEYMKKAWANVVKRPIDWEAKEELAKKELAMDEAAFLQEAWNEFTDEEVDQLCEDGWDDMPLWREPCEPEDYAAEPPKKLNSEEEYMDAMEAKREEEYLKWLAESEIVDGGAA